MRIGIVAPEFPPDIGGVETYSYEFSAELARRGHTVVVFTPAHGNGATNGQGFRVLPELTFESARDRLLPQRYPMDVWHVMNAAFAWLALEAAPVIVSVHGNDFIRPYCLPRPPALPQAGGLWRLHDALAPVAGWIWNKLGTRAMAKGLSRARQVIANSEYTRALLVQRYPDCAGSASVGFVGVNEEFLRTEHIRCGATRRRRLVTVCRLNEPRKNVDQVLRALARMKNYPFEYTVVGDGHLRPGLQELCRELDLDDRVSFTGSVSPDDIRRILAGSDLFVLTSGVLADSVEGFGIAYLEANACGTPVLACRGAGAVEAVDEGRTGYFVDEPKVEALVGALEQFFRDEVSFKPADCKDFAARFRWSRVVDHAFQYYTQVG